jgi:preprotein translocase subunit SecD
MKKSTIWQLIVSALVIILAVLLVLDIQHPDWIKGLLFWQPEETREIAWRYGVDLGDTYRIILLAPDVSAGQEGSSAVQMQATLSVVKSRAQSLSMTDPVVQLQGNFIAVYVSSLQDITVMTQTLQAPGLVEFISAGSQPPGSAQSVETTLGAPPEAEAQPTVTPTPTATPMPTATTAPTPTPEVTATTTLTPTESTPTLTPTATVTPTMEVTPTQEPPATELPTVYETILTDDHLEYIQLRPPSYGYYGARFKFKPTAQNILLNHNLTHPGEYICITLDKRVLDCALADQLFETDQSGGTSLRAVDRLVDIGEGQAQSTSALFRSGKLPVQLRVEKVEPAGPTLGEAVTQAGISSIIALVAALVFLLVHYRMSGLVADLALLAFALLGLALCRILPLPITLASTTGLAAAGLVAVGSILSIAERLRKGMQAGQPLPKAVEASFSKAWPSIRNTHLALLLLAIVTWSVGAITTAQTIYWLGAALVTGTLVSLFVIMIFSRTLMRSILSIDAVQGWLNERKWLMGI